MPNASAFPDLFGPADDADADSPFSRTLFHLAMGGDPDDLPPEYQQAVPHAQMLLAPAAPLGPGLLGDVRQHLAEGQAADLPASNTPATPPVQPADDETNGEGEEGGAQDERGPQEDAADVSAADGSGELNVPSNPVTPVGPLDTSVHLPQFKARPEVKQAMALQQAQRDLADPKVQALLATMRSGEGGDRYNAIVNSTKGFKDFSRHPNVSVIIRPAGPGADGKMRSQLTSTAAGAYQLTKDTWDEAAKALGLTDFQPKSQDLAAAYWLRTLGATDKLSAGDAEGAMHAAGKKWQIFPKAGGEAIAAPGQTPRRPLMAPLLRAYNDKLGRLQ